MLKNKKTEIFNFDDCEVSERNGMYGGMAGLKEGIVWDNEFWLVKYPKTTKGMDVNGLSYTTSPLSEYIGSQIYDILGYDVHKTVLGERHGKIIVACKDFCKNVGDLREIRTLKNIYNDFLAERLELELNETDSSHTVNLRELLIHFENNPVLSTVEGVKDRFWDCAIIDGIIKNNDRNNGNWGLLYEEKEYKIAPIFDNGASFSNKISDQKIEKLLNDPNKLRNNSLNSITTYALDGKQLNLAALLGLDIQELKEAICRVTPILIEKLSAIKTSIEEIPNEYKHLLVCSENRKSFYIKGIELRVQELLEPAYHKACKELNITTSLNFKLKRCEWVKDEYDQRYHDEEWGNPLHDDQKLFEFLILEGMQAGLSWNTILKKREHFREVFDFFDPYKVAQYDETKILALLEDPGIIRNRLKVRGAVKNAQAFLRIQAEFGSFDNYLWSYVNHQPIINHYENLKDAPTKNALSDELSKDLKKRGFTFVGSTIIYAFMEAIGMINDHTTSCFAHPDNKESKNSNL